MPQPVVVGGFGQGQKGFVSAPTAQTISRILNAATELPNPAAVESPSVAAAVEAGTVQRSALAEQGRPHDTRLGIYAILLPGPGGDLLRGVFEDLAPTLDRESGDFVHWVLLGDPRRTRAYGERLLLDLAQGREVLEELWRVRLGRHADARDLAASETDALANLYGIAIDDLPAVLVVATGQQSLALPMRLPAATLLNVEVAKQVSQTLRKHLHPDALRGSGTEPNTLHRVMGAVSNCIIEFRGGALAPPIPQVPNDLKRHAVLDLVRRGASVVRACDQVKITRQALYKDPAFKRQLQEVQAMAKAVRLQMRRGRSHRGVIETAVIESDGDDVLAADLPIES